MSFQKNPLIPVELPPLQQCVSIYKDCFKDPSKTTFQDHIYTFVTLNRSLPFQPELYENQPFELLRKHCSSFYKDKSFVDAEDKPHNYIYIRIYKHEAQPKSSVLCHWHYVGFGLSDLHGYGFPTKSLIDSSAPNDSKLKSNGYGIELTFRLECKDFEQDPPDWPINLLQNLAGHVFKTEKSIKQGDCKFTKPTADSNEITYLLFTKDLELGVASIPSGDVTFIQVVKVAKEKFIAALKSDVETTLDSMKKSPQTGGPLLVTRINER